MTDLSPVEEPTCCYCGLPDTGERKKRGDARDSELRPYGPGGANVCYSCATESPEREEAAHLAYGTLLAANEAMSPTGVVVIGDPSGPRPFDPKEAS